MIPWIIWTNRTISVSHFEINNKKLAADFDDFKIAHLSDLHNKDWEGKLIEKMTSESPDLIAITGDLVDSRNTDVDVALEFIESAIEIAPIYYVTGNHEARLGEEYLTLKEGLESLGVEVITDASRSVEIGSNKIQLTGIQDPDFSDNIYITPVQENLDKTFDSETFKVLLSHRPEYFKDYVKSGADLVLTGHAHGGQVRIPFIGGLIAPNQGIFPEYSEGLYHEEGTDMIVSRGLGNSIIPVRINNRPELVIIELQSE
ncbi:MAG: metallophosphoesterase [Atopostipes suicloacalis]|nr:metallophosphoesterase [Atopostipes suicloacalis]MDN6730964.1 metallophosphoesterase [Atopostipes suicloacalis]